MIPVHLFTLVHKGSLVKILQPSQVGHLLLNFFLNYQFHNKTEFCIKFERSLEIGAFSGTVRQNNETKQKNVPIQWGLVHQWELTEMFEHWPTDCWLDLLNWIQLRNIGKQCKVEDPMTRRRAELPVRCKLVYQLLTQLACSIPWKVRKKANQNKYVCKISDEQTVK